MKKRHYERLLNTLSELARRPLANESFQVSRLQLLKTLFRDLNAYRKFAVMMLEDVQADVEKSPYSPLIPLADKIRLFEQVRQAVVNSSDQGVIELERLGEELYTSQPGWKRIGVHSTRRKALDHQMLLLEHVAYSFVANRADSGFQAVCLYISTFKGERFKFATDAGDKLLKIEKFWKHHPPEFTNPPVRVPRPSQRLPLPHYLELAPKPPPMSEAAQAAERIKRGEQRYQLGDWLMHEYFGRGVIVGVEEAGRIVSITFENRSTKRLLTTVAPMWPIPKPDKDELKPPELSNIVRKVLEDARLPDKGIVDADDLEEMEDPVEIKLAKAAYNLSKAKKLFSSFVRSVGSSRFYEAGDDLSKAITRLKGAKNRTCEAWLFMNGYISTDYDDRDTLAGRFEERAPRKLLRKALLLEEKLTHLFYGHTFIDDAYGGVVAPPEQRLDEVAYCLQEVESLYLHIKTGCDMESFRWEQTNDFQLGQWVFQLSNNPLMYCELNLSLTHWNATEKLVIAVEKNEVVLRTPDRRSIERVFIDSLTLQPSPRLPENMSLPFYARRTWFETHTEYLKGLKPCPCCGYPFLTTVAVSEWCAFCYWEDNGQDDHNANEILGESNGTLSLTEARKNFETKFCAFQQNAPEFEHIEWQKRLPVTWKRRIAGLYDRLITVETLEEAENLWKEIERNWRKYRDRE